jgi:hypothetical protein
MNTRAPLALVALVALGCHDPAPPPVAPTPPTSAAAPSTPAISSAAPALPPTATPAPTPPKPTWPPAFDQELAVGCLAWSETEATAACVTGGGSIAHGHAYAVAFIGAAPQEIPIVSWPPQDFDDHPLVLPVTEREKVRARFVAKGYAPLPAPIGQLSPTSPLAGDRFSLRMVRKKVKHVSIPQAGAWDVYRESIELACRAPKAAYRTIDAITVENPSDAPADVHLLGGRWLLVGHRTSYGIEGDIGGRLDVKVVDLDKIGCNKAP